MKIDDLKKVFRSKRYIELFDIKFINDSDRFIRIKSLDELMMLGKNIEWFHEELSNAELDELFIDYCEAFYKNTYNKDNPELISDFRKFIQILIEHNEFINLEKEKTKFPKQRLIVCNIEFSIYWKEIVVLEKVSKELNAEINNSCKRFSKIIDETNKIKDNIIIDFIKRFKEKYKASLTDDERNGILYTIQNELNRKYGLSVLNNEILKRENLIKILTDSK